MRVCVYVYVGMCVYVELQEAVGRASELGDPAEGGPLGAALKAARMKKKD